MQTFHAAETRRLGSLQPTQLPTRDLLAAGALLIGAFAVAYHPVIATLWDQWQTNDTYSFGILVPFISGYLIWVRRHQLAALPVAPSLAAGGLVVLSAALLLLIGRASAIVAFQEFSLVLMVAGLVLLLLGRHIARAIWFPLVYLLLMLPVWEILTDRLHPPSQLFSASLAESLLTTIGVPVYREGIDLHLPQITLEVASVCSGVNFLIAVIAVGVPQSYIFLQGIWPRAAVVAIALAVALLSNGLRVAVIGSLLYFDLSDSTHGPGHILQGLFVSSFGIVAVLATVAILARYYPRPPELDVPSPPASPPPPHRLQLGLASVLACTMLLGVSVVNPARLLASQADGDSNAIVMAGGWRSVEQPQAAPYVLPAERMAAWVYEGEQGERVDLFIGRLMTTNIGQSLAYRAVNLPNGMPSSQYAIQLPDGRTLQVNRAAFDAGGRHTVILYWYAAGGRYTPQVSTAKVFGLAHLFLSGPEPRLVMVVAQSRNGPSAIEALLPGLLQPVAGSLAAPP